MMNTKTMGSRRPLLGIALAIAFSCVCAAPLAALDVPALTSPVIDQAGIMNGSERAELASYLTAVSEQTGMQLAVLTIPSLEGESLEDYSMRVADEWELGAKGTDNGALLLVSMEDRAIRIEAGYGLEDRLTDAKSGLIIRNVIAPQFRAGRYGDALIEASKNIVGIATDDAAIVSSSLREGADTATSSGGGIGGIVFFLMFLLFVLPRLRGRGILGPLILGSMLSSGRRGGSGFGGNVRSGGSRGGFSGFSGGGGGFGGGGASGGW